jgi:AraC-like DNA-binding protein
MNANIFFHETGKDPHFKIWHASENAMIIYMHSDGGSIVCSQKSYPIHKGVLCFVGAGKHHYTMPDEPEFYDRSKLFVSPHIVSRLFKLLSNTECLHSFAEDSFIYAYVEEGEQNIVENIFRELKQYENDDLYFEMILYSCCMKLLFYLDKYSLETTTPTSGLMNKAIEYINHHIFQNIDIDEICASIHISKYYFCRQFKKTTGMTVMNYILKTRIILAQDMLSKEKLSVAEISERCGFSSISYFCRVFKNETGKTPLEYRRHPSAY